VAKIQIELTSNTLRKRLYLDHASTSWPKTDGVIKAMTAFMTECGASASRGNYAAARTAEQIVQRVRHRLAERINAESVDSITFHSGCTAALNAAIHGLLKPGDHAICSAVEHNSVLRPLMATTETTTVPSDHDGRMNVDRMVSQIRDETRLIALTHASNVTGIVQPVRDLTRAISAINDARSEEQRIFVLCDAAQTFGYLPIDVRELEVGGLAAPAHKGSGGPTGIAMLYLNSDWHGRIAATTQGGSGHDGLSDSMPPNMPGRLEAGTTNVAAIAGWDAALNVKPNPDFTRLSQVLHDGLGRIPGIEIFGGRGDLPIASIGFGEMLSPAEAAAILDHEFAIEVRSGFHCAGKLHEHLGSHDGTIRISCGNTTQPSDLDRLFAAVEEIATSLRQ
jgi:selenocysteine lyase/cysteine desulfurase